MSMTHQELYAFLRDKFTLNVASGMTCKRCGMDQITWAEKHAAERHGDDIDVEPIDPQYGDEKDLKW